MNLFHGPIIITHRQSGRVREFNHPRDAALFVEECKAKKVLPEHLEIDNQSGVSLSVYNDERVPRWAQDLIQRMELENGGNIVPRWHFMKSKKKYRTYSVGHSYYASRSSTSVTHISITYGSDELDFRGVIIHEFAHALQHAGEHHGKAFYNTMFSLLRQYVPFPEEKKIVEREFRYKKSSRYWYAERYNIESILSQYRPVAASKPTTNDIIDSLFED